jgi:hypothetical protein
MSIRVPRKEDATEMAHVLYEGLRPLRHFSILWPRAQRDNWIEVQADYCIQHLEERHSVAFITVDDEGTMTGMVYGRFLDAETLPASTGLKLIGCDNVELGKLENQTIHKALIEKYGGVLCKRLWTILLVGPTNACLRDQHDVDPP